MKVNNHPHSQQSKKASKKQSRADVEAKLKAKFGNIKKPKKVNVEDKVEMNSGGGIKASGEKGFGDIGKNDPNSESTQEKLRGILKAGAFNFNDKERRALAQILKK